MPHSTKNFFALFAQLVNCCYLLVAMEWLFFITKPSFFSVLGLGQSLEVLLITSLGFTVLGLILFAGALGSYFLGAKNFTSKNFSILVLPAAFVITVLTVLMIDNFSYTVFKSGIVRTKSYQPLVYLFVICWIFVGYVIWFSRGYVAKTAGRKKWDMGQALALCGISLVLVLFNLVAGDSSQIIPSSDHASIRKPNILFFASDGINADNMSIYGYPRKTSPRLDELSESSLIALGALSNSSRTTGSTTSMLTGKLPTTTKVFFPPHALTGQNAYQHLPGILRKLGYRNFQETLRYYADGPDLNMRFGFDVANGREVINWSLPFVSDQAVAEIVNSQQFFDAIAKRVSDRALHVFKLKKMNDPYRSVIPGKGTQVYGVLDKDRIERSIDFIRQANKPFLMHIHLMESHCCRFKPSLRKFSANHKKNTRDVRGDFLDDAIFSADHLLGRIIDVLKETDKFENTIIIYSSDHTMGWRVNGRMPLVFRFPNGENAGVIEKTVQLADVMPTILEYMHLPIPEWVEGQTLIGSNELKEDRAIFSVASMHRDHFSNNRERLSKLVGDGPPLYGLKNLMLAICHKWYAIDVKTGKAKSGDIKNHPAPCADNRVLDGAKARTMVRSHLSERGFGPLQW